MLDVVRRGLAVTPLWPGSKRAMLTDWPNRTTSDPDVIRRHWQPGWNIGIPMKANGLVGIDLDRHDPAKDGVAGLTALCERYDQPWPFTFTAGTANGGLHLYMRTLPGRSFGNTSNRLAPGIDTRGPGAGNGGGYLVGPGSVVNRRPYRVVRDAPIIELPGWLAELLDPPRQPVRWDGPPPQVDDRYVSAALKGEIQRVLDSPGRGRNHQLNRSAFALGQLVAAGVLDEVTVVVELRRAAEAIGLVAEDGERQTNATIRSGLTAGGKNPRRLAGAR